MEDPEPKHCWQSHTWKTQKGREEATEWKKTNINIPEYLPAIKVKKRVYGNERWFLSMNAGNQGE